MLRLVSVLRLVALAICLAAAAPYASAQQALAPSEQQVLDRAREALRRIEPLVEQRAENFAELLDLREELEPYRDSLRGLARELQERLTAAQARLRALGPQPAFGAPAERPEIAADRRRYTALVTELEGGLGATRAVLLETEQMWDDITERRRALFATRLFEHRDSFFDPDFWSELFTTGLPLAAERGARRIAEIREHIEENEAWSVLGFVAVLMTGLVAGLVLLHRWLARRRARHSPESGATPTRGAIVARAVLILIMRAVPFATVAFGLALAVSRFEVVGEAVETFLMGLAGSLFVFGLGSGAAVAVFAPSAPAYRVVAASDAVAARAVRVVTVLLGIFLAGIIGHGLEQLIVTHTSVTIANAGLVSLAVVVVGAVLMLRAPGEDGPVSGIVGAPLHVLRPIFWILAALVLGALVFGYISLAHFVAGRAIATVAILCLATLVYVAIEAVLHDALAPGTSANGHLARTFGVRPATIDLIGTILAGFLRVVTVVVTVIVLFSPWGIQFGGMNPFDDAFFGLRFGDLRGAFGTAGIALSLFAIGLLATRMFVTWLDQQLLPRTGMDVGVRHSITTVAGYVGLVAAVALSLGQAGVELQNVALVAGALSVGIGFGLQQVVSNFVAGLIVLAERPIRVGDVINVKGEEGKVTRISVRATELALAEKSTVIVPNADLISSIVKNRSLVDPTQRIKIALTVTYDSDVDAALAAMLASVAGHERIAAGTVPSANIVAVGAVGIDLELVLICDDLQRIETVRTQVLGQILRRFREAGIRFAGALPAAPGAEAPAPAAGPAPAA